MFTLMFVFPHWLCQLAWPSCTGWQQGCPQAQLLHVPLSMGSHGAFPSMAGTLSQPKAQCQVLPLPTLH